MDLIRRVERSRFVRGERYSLVRWVEVERDDVTGLRFQLRVRRKLECRERAGLKVIFSPKPGYGRVMHAELAGQRP